MKHSLGWRVRGRPQPTWPVLIRHCWSVMTQSSMPVYPPHAQERVSVQGSGGPVSEQPKAGVGMSPSMTYGDAGKQDKPMRLRGGCIPCPVSYTFYIPWQVIWTDINVDYREEESAGSYPFHAAVRHCSEHGEIYTELFSQHEYVNMSMESWSLEHGHKVQVLQRFSRIPWFYELSTNGHIFCTSH